ncbi:unnamed protein product [marine sediment metagenome]|uniref:Uncharacterized protein n=1 Tax=marine sediment metagenome TaxID=412755 RepID=X0UCU5_9ZZZZ
MRLKDKFWQIRLDEEIAKRREAKIIDKIRNADFSVPGEYSVDSIGKWYTRAFIFPGDPKDVKTLARELGDLFEVAWELDFREKEGTFMYKARKKDYYGKNEDFLVFVENVPTPPNCKIEKKTKTVDYYEKICNQAEAIVK